jgi:RNA polymerase sigma-70 factor (ECF subfamily)
VSDSLVNPTPVSLLEQLQRPSGDAQVAWRRFVQLYTPLLFDWARRTGAPPDEAADLVQEVFQVLARELPAFRYRPGQRFRGWLWTILRNKWRDHLRRLQTAPPQANAAALETVTVPDNVAEMTEEEYRTHLVGRALQLMQAEFAEADWRACWQNVVEGRPAAEVAAALGLTVNQVYLAKSRILHRLRTELKGLFDDE